MDGELIFVIPSDEVAARIATNHLYYEMTNGFRRPILESTNEEDVYAALKVVFNQIGIKNGGMVSHWGSDHFELFVPLKNQF